jgi:hypothetical protein
VAARIVVLRLCPAPGLILLEGYGPALALRALAFGVTRAAQWRQHNRRADLPPEVLDPKVRAKVGDRARRPAPEGEEVEGYRRDGEHQKG